MRIVSLAPNVTGILVALGAEGSLVGMTRWCKDVLPADKLKSFNHLALFDDCWNADIPAVAALHPDLVIGSVPYRAKVVEGLVASGIRFLATYPRSLADIYHETRLLGRIVDAAPAADRLVEWMEAEIESVRCRAAGSARRPRIYCEEWSNPLQNSQAWVAELVEAGGGEFVPKPAARKVTSEEVIAANPEAIVVAWCGTNDRSRPDVIQRRPGWTELDAVKHGRIHVVRDELLNTPGPNLIEGLHALAAIIHPDLFAQRRDGS